VKKSSIIYQLTTSICKCSKDRVHVQNMQIYATRDVFFYIIVLPEYVNYRDDKSSRCQNLTSFVLHKNKHWLYKKLSHRRETARQLPIWRGA